MLRFIVISKEVQTTSYFTDEIKTHKENEQTAERIMRRKWDNQQQQENQGNNRHFAFVPVRDNQFIFTGWLFGTCSKLSGSHLELCCMPHQRDWKCSCTCRDGFIFLDVFTSGKITVAWQPKAHSSQCIRSSHLMNIFLSKLPPTPSNWANGSSFFKGHVLWHSLT